MFDFVLLKSEGFFMFKPYTAKTILLTLFMSLFLSACGTATKQPTIESFVTPEPPSDPKIVYLKRYRGESDFTKGNTLDQFIGTSGGLNSKNIVKPYGLVASNNKLYVADTAMGVVFVFDTEAKKVTFIGDQPSGKLAQPIGVALDANSNLYVTDSKLQRIFGYDPTGKLIFSLGEKNEFIRPTGIAINKDAQMMYVVDTKGHNVKVYSLDGTSLFEFGKRGSLEGEFNFPTNIAVDERNGNVVVVDTQNFRVQIFNQDGKFLQSFGQLGDMPGTFSRPRGVAIDSEGHIYISDASFDNIQVFNDSGELLLYFGSAGYMAGQFQMPAALAFDNKDRLYVSENFAGKIQVFQYVGSLFKSNSPEQFKRLMKSREARDDY